MGYTLWRHQTWLTGKSTDWRCSVRKSTELNGPFSIAIFDYRRVIPHGEIVSSTMFPTGPRYGTFGRSTPVPFMVPPALLVHVDVHTPIMHHRFWSITTSSVGQICSCLWHAKIMANMAGNWLTRPGYIVSQRSHPKRSSDHTTWCPPKKLVCKPMNQRHLKTTNISNISTRNLEINVLTWCQHTPKKVFSS